MSQQNPINAIISGTDSLSRLVSVSTDHQTFQIEIPDHDIGRNKDIDPQVVVKTLKQTTMDWTAFEQHLKSGQPYSFNIVERRYGKRNASGFQVAYHFAMDSDRNATLAEILNPANPLAQFIRYIAPSPSDSTAYRKLRVIFQLSTAIHDKTLLSSILQLFYDEFLRFGVRFDMACLDVARWYYAKETKEIANFESNALNIPAEDYQGIIRLPNCEAFDFTQLRDYVGELQTQLPKSTIAIADQETFSTLLEEELRQAGVFLERRDGTDEKIFCTFKLTHCHTSSEHAEKDNGRGEYSNANVTVWNNGGLSYHCYGGTCKNKGISHFLRSFKIKSKELKMMIEEATRRSNYTPQLIAPEKYPHSKIVNERYLSNALSIRETEERMVVLNSALGTGKTECLKNYVELCQKSNSTVLTVIPRRTLGTQAAIRFDIVDYQGETRDEMTICRSRTVCIPSLNKLIDEENGSDIPSYDVLLIDEPSNVLKFFTSQGQGLFNAESPSTHALDCFRVLKEIGRKARKIVIAEACMDQRVAWILRRMFDVPLDDCLLVKNDYHENLPVTLWGVTDHIRESEIYAEVDQFFAQSNRPRETRNRFRDCMKHKMLSSAVATASDANIPLVIACDEKENGAHGIRRFLIEELGIPEGSILVITSETKEFAEVHTFLEDPNGFIQTQQPKVIIHTAAMETGFSVEEKCGVVVVADSRNHTLDASALLQMMGRCRNPAFIYALLDERFRFENTDSEELITLLITNHKSLAAKHKLTNQRLSNCHAWMNEIHGQLTAESNRQRVRLIESVPALISANGFDVQWIDAKAMEKRGCDFHSLVGEDSLQTAKAVRNERITRADAIIESTATSPDVANQHRKNLTVDETTVAGEKKGKLLELTGAQWTGEGKTNDTLQIKSENAALLNFVESSTFNLSGEPCLVPTQYDIEKRGSLATLKKTKGFIVSQTFVENRETLTNEQWLTELFVNNTVKNLKLHKPRNQRRFESFCDFHAESETLTNWDLGELQGAIPFRAFKDPRRQIVAYALSLVEQIGEESEAGIIWIREWDKSRINGLGDTIKSQSVRYIDGYIRTQFAKDSGIARCPIQELIRSYFSSTARLIDRGDYLSVLRQILYDYFYRVNATYNTPITDEKLTSILPLISGASEVKRTDTLTYVTLDTYDCLERVNRNRLTGGLEIQSIRDCLSFLNAMQVDGNHLGLAWFMTQDEQKFIGLPCRVYREFSIDTAREKLLLNLKATPTDEQVATASDIQTLKNLVTDVLGVVTTKRRRNEALAQILPTLREANNPLSSKNIAEKIGLAFTDANKRAILRRLDKLLKERQIAKTGHNIDIVYFTLPCRQEPHRQELEIQESKPDSSDTVPHTTDSEPVVPEVKPSISTNPEPYPLISLPTPTEETGTAHGCLSNERKAQNVRHTEKTEESLSDGGLEDCVTNTSFLNKKPLYKNDQSVTQSLEACLHQGLVIPKVVPVKRFVDEEWYVVNDEKVDEVLGWLGKGDTFGLDFETYADCDIDDPRYLLDAKPRVLSISNGTRTVIFDCPMLEGLPETLRPWLTTKTVICHNATFDMAFLHRMNILPQRIVDTMIMEGVILSAEGRKGQKSLKAVCERYLGETLAKDEQTADWSPETVPVLSESMITYSAKDAKVLVPLHDALHAKIEALGMDERAYQIFCDAIPANVDARQTGMPIDTKKTCALHDRLQAEANRIEADLTRSYGGYGYGGVHATKKIIIVLGRAFGVDIKSTNQEHLTRLGKETTDTALKAFCDDVLSARRVFKIAKELEKYLKMAIDGRIFANFRLNGAQGSGRTTSSNPNLQQVSKSASVLGILKPGEVRGCFVAPAGYRLVIADYSQVELVLNAVHCNDEEMLNAFRAGADIHAHTASKIYKKPITEISKAERQIGKTANFGLQYGMGVDGFRNSAKSYGVQLSTEDALSIRQAWFVSYPNIATAHSHVKVQKPQTVQTIVGRVLHAQKTNALNLPIQGSGADLLNRATAIIHNRLESFDASIVAFVHDELVVMVAEAEAKAVAEVVSSGMAEAGKDLYPMYHDLIRSDVKISQNWGDDA